MAIADDHHHDTVPKSGANFVIPGLIDIDHVGLKNDEYLSVGARE